MRILKGILLFLTIGATSAMASDVYIEQIGDNTTIAISQTGGTGNTIGSSSDPAYINGSANTLSVTQDGTGNEANLNINGGSTSVTTTDSGSGNSTSINVDGATGTTTTTTVTGDNNQVNVCKTVDALGGCSDGITANDTTQNVTVTGDSNVTNLNIDSANATSTVTITGGSNTTDISQTGVAGANGHSITMSHTGSTGSININQSGANDQQSTITTSGDNLTLSVTQGD